MFCVVTVAGEKHSSLGYMVDGVGSLGVYGTVLLENFTNLTWLKC